ncbi:MAG: hypothetical protein GX087_08365 [Desulfobulbaceae bacterium]|nr:hypothetical protein [Desulfobulbaceae bacterium]
MARTRTKFDLDCMYCPQCGDEYRAEITTCAECKVALVSGALMAESTMPPVYREIEPHEELLAVRRGPILLIRQLQAYLRSVGLASLIGPGEDGCKSGCRGPEVELKVRASEAEEVYAALAQEHRQSTGLWEPEHALAGARFDVEVGQAACPACGCLFSADTVLCPDCGLRFV